MFAMGLLGFVGVEKGWGQLVMHCGKLTHVVEVTSQVTNVIMNI